MTPKTFFLTISIFISICGCGNISNVKIPNYEVLREEKTETNNKAQITTFAIYNDTTYTESIMKKVMLDIYDKTKNKNIFENHAAPTVVGAYVYTSKKMAENDKGSWIAMFTKGPNDEEPKLFYQDIKINSLQGLNDKDTSSDEIALQNLNNYLGERKLILCDFYKQLSDIELECIRKADKKYPDFGEKHLAYSEKLIEDEQKKLILKHSLADSIFLQVSVFGFSYCK
jgi:hypothetical protein